VSLLWAALTKHRSYWRVRLLIEADTAALALV